MKESEKEITKLRQKALEARKRVIKASSHAHLEHVGSAFSEMEILISLYWKILNVSSLKPQDPNRDRFILSKGHAVLGLYAVLEQKGFIKEKELNKYGENGTKLAGHPVLGSAAGIENVAGSLGHGLSLGSGIAFVAKADKKKYKTFVLLSDGECNEGSIWEAIFLAGHLGLDNLTAIIDYNKIQSLAPTKEVVNMEPFAEKWANAGWQVEEVDGHNIKQLLNVFSNKIGKNKKPTVVIAHTVKGKGLPVMENTVASHYKVIKEEEVEQMVNNLYLV